MPNSREDWVVCARLAAERILTALDEGKYIVKFVDAYASTHNRAELRNSPLRYRELLTTLHREALLAASGAVLGDLPRKLSRKKKGLLSGAEAESAAAFQEEFLMTLGEWMGWTAAEAEEFSADLALCRQIAARLPARKIPPRGRPFAKNPPGNELPQGPFVERCALLLDPSFLDQALRTAGRFQQELESLAERVLAGVIRART